MPFVYGEGHLNNLTDEQLASQFTQLDGFKEYVQDIVRAKRQSPVDIEVRQPRRRIEIDLTARRRRAGRVRAQRHVEARVDERGGRDVPQGAARQRADLAGDRRGRGDVHQRRRLRRRGEQGPRLPRRRRGRRALRHGGAARVSESAPPAAVAVPEALRDGHDPAAEPGAASQADEVARARLRQPVLPRRRLRDRLHRRGRARAPDLRRALFRPDARCINVCDQTVTNILLLLPSRDNRRTA